MTITWPQIGNQYFVHLEGDVDPQADTLVETTRGGVDGVAYRKTGKRGTDTVLAAVAVVADESAADTLMTSYKAMVSTVVSIVQAGVTRTNYLVLDVQVIKRKQVGQKVGGKFSDGTDLTAGVGWLVLSRWVVRYKGT